VIVTTGSGPAERSSVAARENSVARSQEQQSFMLIGVFELIQAKRTT
jgi:hypothetical protein